MHLIATIGPRSSQPEIIDKIIEGGINTIRINLSHGIYENIDEAVKYIRAKYNDINILMDLQGNKIRVSNKLKTSFRATEKSNIYFCSEDDYESYLRNKKYNNLIPLNISRNILLSKSFKKIYMKDGTMEFITLGKENYTIKTLVKIGGIVRAEKGCNLPGIDRSGWGLTEKDIRDIEYALSRNVDIISYSYCCNKIQCKELKENIFAKLKNKQAIPKIWGKIETKDGIDNIKEISQELDGVVIARGDLVPETHLLNIPIIQDKIVNSLKGEFKEIIVATNVLNSMKNNNLPTINELSDIYTLIKGGATGFMLTGETTVGKKHKEVVSLLKQVTDYYKEVLKKAKKKKDDLIKNN
ncbi:pyruvate kinase [Clostridium tarantellae]|uniref:Pyruvate kinase n=1 Tax=Clostridium tarantellae TaxID=39493 RepID=A0A6I1MKW4_9CLOT|nr:pyruvate kinase [Clostridium tarantellae]MPQ43614.1 pyruvate kinase [Clostridium tarantellae]